MKTEKEVKTELRRLRKKLKRTKADGLDGWFCALLEDKIIALEWVLEKK